MPSRKLTYFSAPVITGLIAVGFALFCGNASLHAAQAVENNSAATKRPGLNKQVIVKFRYKGANRSSRAIATLQSVSTRLGRQLKPLRMLRSEAMVVEVEEEQDMEDLLKDLSARTDVEYVEPDRMLHPFLSPNDTRYYEQWHYFENAGGLNLPSAWDSTQGSGVVVAVVDTGYRPHADLVASILPGYDMIGNSFVGNDGNGRDNDAQDPGDWTTVGDCGLDQPPADQISTWHGTHVAGTLAAVTNNSSGVAGVAFQAKVLPVRVLGKCGGFTSDIAEGILWAAGIDIAGVPSNANPAQVISLSLGGPGSCSYTLQSAIEQARSAGATIVVAAGNSNQDAVNTFPANCEGIVTVAATNRTGGKAYYSNFGSSVDLAAPGGDMSFSFGDGILSTSNSGSTVPTADSIEFKQGTSMATPHVAGLAALLYSVDPDISPAQVMDTLISTARSFPNTCSGCGSGIADATAAVAALNQSGGGDEQLENAIPHTDLAGSLGSERFFSLQVPEGASNLTFQISGGTGDADLYVRFGAPPTLSSWDYRPYINGNSETVVVNPVQPGEYFVMLRGYSSYSGVSLIGRYEEQVAGTNCPAGHEQYTASLAATGSYQYAPNGSYYFSPSGTHSGILSGPSGTNFDLILWKWSNSRWNEVMSSANGGSEEAVNYLGGSGYYIWRVESRSGAGDFKLCLAKP